MLIGQHWRRQGLCFCQRLVNAKVYLLTTIMVRVIIGQVMAMMALLIVYIYMKTPRHHLITWLIHRVIGVTIVGVPFV